MTTALPKLSRQKSSSRSSSSFEKVPGSCPSPIHGHNRKSADGEAVHRYPGGTLPAWKWTELTLCHGNLPPNMSGISADVVDRVMYVYGGYYGGRAQDDLYALDLLTGIWTLVKTAGAKPAPRTSHSMVADPIANKLYVVCGSGTHFGLSNLDDIFELDLSLQVWQKMEFTGDVMSARYGQTTVLYSKKLFVFGGTSGREFSQEFFMFDLETMVCRSLPLLGAVPSPRYKHAAAMFSHNKMLVFGGAEQSNQHLNDVSIVDLDTYYWTRLDCGGDKPVGRFAHSLVIHANKAFVFGGVDRDPNPGDLFVLDIVARVWAPISCSGHAPRGRYFVGSAFDTATASWLLWGGKGSTDAPNRYNDLHMITVDPSVVVDPTYESSLARDLIALLCSGNGSDLTVVSSDGVELPAHQLIVRCRCQTMADEIQLDHLHISRSAIVVEHILWFIYGDDLPDSNLPHDLGVELLLTALSFHLHRLAQLCERRLRRSITADRARDCLPALSSHISDPRLHPFIAFLIEYLRLRHMTDYNGEQIAVPSSSSDIQCSTLRCDIVYLRSLSSATAIARSMPFDIRFRCGQSGDDLLAHQLILSARSRYFGSFAFREGMREALTGLCTFPDAGEGVLSRDAFTVLLDYLYGEDVAVSHKISFIIAHELLRIDVCNYFGLGSSHLEMILNRVLDPQYQRQLSGAMTMVPAPGSVTSSCTLS